MRITVDMAVLPSHSSSGKMQRRRIRLARDKNDRGEQERSSSVTSIIPVIPATAQWSALSHASPDRAIAIIRHFPISAGLSPRSLAEATFLRKRRSIDDRDRDDRTISNRSILKTLGWRLADGICASRDPPFAFSSWILFCHALYSPLSSHKTKDFPFEI